MMHETPIDTEYVSECSKLFNFINEKLPDDEYLILQNLDGSIREVPAKTIEENLINSNGFSNYMARPVLNKKKKPTRYERAASVVPTFDGEEHDVTLSEVIEPSMQNKNYNIDSVTGYNYQQNDYGPSGKFISKCSDIGTYITSNLSFSSCIIEPSTDWCNKPDNTKKLENKISLNAFNDNSISFDYKSNLLSENCIDSVKKLNFDKPSEHIHKNIQKEHDIRIAQYNATHNRNKKTKLNKYGDTLKKHRETDIIKLIIFISSFIAAGSLYYFI